MANMSYCRFQNTTIDLEECLDVLRDREYEKVSLSKDEYYACENMFDSIITFFTDEGIIEYDQAQEISEKLEELLDEIH